MVVNSPPLCPVLPPKKLSILSCPERLSGVLKMAETLGADGQRSPDDLPKLHTALSVSDFDVSSFPLHNALKFSHLVYLV